MALDNLTDQELELVANGQLDKLSDSALEQIAGVESATVSNLDKIKEKAKTALNVLAVPSELGGEAIRGMRQGFPFRVPTLLKNSGIENQYLTSKEPPADFVQQVISPMSELPAGAYAALQGKGLQGIGEAMQAEYNRPKTEIADVASQLTAGILFPSVANAPMDAAAKIIPKVLAPAGKLAAGISSVGTGVKPRDYETVFKNPSSFLPSKLDKAKAAYRAEKQALGIPNELTAEQIKQLRNPGDYAFKLAARLKSGEKISPKDAQAGIESINAIFPIPNNDNGSYIRMLTNIKNDFKKVVNSASYKMGQVSKEYGSAKAAQKFKSILPRTQSGVPNYFRSLAALGNLLGSRPELSLAAVPALAGGVTATAGMISKALEKITKTDAGRRAILAALALGNDSRKK